MLIKNSILANSTLTVNKELITFDSNGLADVDNNLANELLKLKGYQSVEDKKKVEEPKEEIIATGTVEVIEDEIKTEPDYENLSNKELKELIKADGKKVPSGANKAELIDILKA